MIRRGRAALVTTLVLACALPGQAASPFLDSLVITAPPRGAMLVLSHPGTDMVATYDVALAALWYLDQGRLGDAGRLLVGLLDLQRPGGGLPFSFRVGNQAGADAAAITSALSGGGWPAGAKVYVRSGAVAWAGYAAARWLERAKQRQSKSGMEKGANTLIPGLSDNTALTFIDGLADGCALYVAKHRVKKRGDLRDGLVMGGEGRYTYVREGDRLREVFEPGEMAWVSTEHNIDSYFFLRALARVRGENRYNEVANGIGKALVDRLWDEDAGQFYQGALDAPDNTPALDCASWGATFLAKFGDRRRALKCLESTRRYAARDVVSKARGYRPYRRRLLIESRVAYDFHRIALPASTWDEVEAVWPEGTAGVALAALRLGDKAGAARTLAAMTPLRDPTGALPGLTLEIPTEFTTKPALAGSAWDALVRSELDNTPTTVRLWDD